MSTFQGITQTEFYDPDNPASGNCVEASIATILDISLQSIPKLIPPNCDVITFWDNVDDFLMTVGMRLKLWHSKDYPPGRYLVSGPSVRGCSHMVVYEDGQLLWDPHPSRAGVLEVRYIHTLEPLNQT